MQVRVEVEGGGQAQGKRKGGVHCLQQGEQQQEDTRPRDCTVIIAGST